MIQWKCFELHTHTCHSDGTFAVKELLEAAKNFQYDGIALTDHNTMSGLDELNKNDNPMPVIPGIEWTTYYGHLLVIGTENNTGMEGDWRFALPDTIDRYTQAVKEAGGITGIAHPFTLGSPMCTGCYWDFKVRNWDYIDYIEVWSNPFPQRRIQNDFAFKWWTDLLDKGNRIAASSGWDWHNLEPGKKVLPAATWLGLEDGIINTAAVREALASGRTIVSIGPFPEIEIRREGKVYYPGDTLDAGTVNFSVTLDENRRKEIWGRFGIKTEKLCLIHNGVVVKSSSCNTSPVWEENLDLSPGWIRLEGYGSLESQKDKLLFFTSPWYVK